MRAWLFAGMLGWAVATGGAAMAATLDLGSRGLALGGRLLETNDAELWIEPDGGAFDKAQLGAFSGDVDFLAQAAAAAGDPVLTVFDAGGQIFLGTLVVAALDAVSLEALFSDGAAYALLRVALPAGLDLSGATGVTLSDISAEVFDVTAAPTPVPLPAAALLLGGALAALGGVARRRR